MNYFPENTPVPIVRALQKYGKTAQYGVVLEELAELGTLVARLVRGNRRVIKRKLADETADVFIMLMSLIYIHDMGDMVEERIKFKLKRLDERLGAETKQ